MPAQEPEPLRFCRFERRSFAESEFTQRGAVYLHRRDPLHDEDGNLWVRREGRVVPVRGTVPAPYRIALEAEPGPGDR